MNLKKMILFPIISCVISLCIACCYSEEQAEVEDQKDAAELYCPVTGDEVFFEAISYSWKQEETKGQKVTIRIDEIENGNILPVCRYSGIDGKIVKGNEFLLKRGDNKTYKVSLSCDNKGVKSSSFSITTDGTENNAIFPALDIEANNQRKDSSQWKVRFTFGNGDYVIFQFRGIKRVYAIKEFKFGPRSEPRIRRGKFQDRVPKLFFYIRSTRGNSVSYSRWFDENYIKAPRGWSSQIDVTSSQNQFIVREGVGIEYSIHIVDADVGVFWFDDEITNFTDIQDYIFRFPGYIELPGTKGEESLVRVRFELKN